MANGTNESFIDVLISKAKNLPHLKELLGDAQGFSGVDDFIKNDRVQDDIAAITEQFSSLLSQGKEAAGSAVDTGTNAFNDAVGGVEEQLAQPNVPQDPGQLAALLQALLQQNEGGLGRAGVTGNPLADVASQQALNTEINNAAAFNAQQGGAVQPNLPGNTVLGASPDQILQLLQQLGAGR